MPTRYPELAEFIKQHSVSRGEFRLASGQFSNYYIDGKNTLAEPEGLRLIAEAIGRELEGFKVDAIGGLEIGAIYIATAVSLASLAWPKPLRQFTVRKETKTHGSRKRVEGFVPRGEQVAVVDDVVTTGGSVIQAIEAIREAGCEVAVAITLVDRDAGATQALARLNVPYRPLLTISDLGLSNEQPSRNEKHRVAS